MVRRVKAVDFLSFARVDFTLERLNILIGPNGSGKSNFIELFALLKETPNDVLKTLVLRGGFKDFVRQPIDDPRPHFTIELELDDETQHNLVVERTQADGLKICAEQIRRRDGKLLSREFPGDGDLDAWDRKKSALAQFRDPKHYRGIKRLLEFYNSIGIYRSWTFGPDSPARNRVAKDLAANALESDGSNLGLVLYNLRMWIPEQELGDKIREFLPNAAKLSFDHDGDWLDWGLRMNDGSLIPARRLSDGTLRWLSLLCILFNRNNPELVCIEEPELGLHPDMIGVLANAVKDASTRSQLIVTTHSSELVARFSDLQNAIVVCDADANGTRLRRLAADEVGDEYEDLSLAWASGAIGGVRW